MIYKCKNCSSSLRYDIAAGKMVCAYCGQPTIVFDRISKVRRPDVILPFAVTKEKAHALIERDGTVSYEDDLAPHNVAIMIDSNHFTIGAYSDLTFDTSNLCEGILVDSNGVVYVNYSPYG